MAGLACVVMAVTTTARAQRALSADVYLDKVYGMWIGELLGNYAGRPTEGRIVTGGLPGPVDWNSFIGTTPWSADDDTMLEYMDVQLLKGSVNPTPAAIRQAWQDNFQARNGYGTYIANRQAYYLMQPTPSGGNLLPPATGNYRTNVYWWAIDSQITTESLGAVAPGMYQRAADVSKTFAGVTNDGYAVHAAQYYSVMYSAACLDGELAGGTLGEKVEDLVARGMAVVPETSRTKEILHDVVGWYTADKQAGRLGSPDAWRATQTKIAQKYGANANRYHYWIESTVNVGLTTMALLYGQGDFVKTVDIGVLGGYDNDCNPATAGGLVGLLRGYQGAGGLGGIAAALPATPSGSYDATTYLHTVTGVKTISEVAQDFRAAAELQILAAGGTVSGEGAARTYTLPSTPLAAPLEKPDPTGPKGLVGALLAKGSHVSVSAGIEAHNPADDVHNLDAIIDGITDVTYNGHLGYSTYDGVNAQPAGGDWYRLGFDRMLAFDKLIFYEGESACDTNPRVSPGPLGGYFTNLCVEVRVNGQFVPVTNLTLSEPLDPLTSYQTIELNFDRIAGDAIQIRGDAGGIRQYTAILELEAYGLELTPGDANADGTVDLQDFGALKDHFGLSQGATWAAGDFNADGMVDLQDFGILKDHFGHKSAIHAIPEPAALGMLAAGGLAAVRRRRQRG